MTRDPLGRVGRDLFVAFATLVAFEFPAGCSKHRDVPFPESKSVGTSLDSPIETHRESSSLGLSLSPQCASLLALIRYSDSLQARQPEYFKADRPISSQRIHFLSEERDKLLGRLDSLGVLAPDTKHELLTLSLSQFFSLRVRDDQDTKLTATQLGGAMLTLEDFAIRHYAASTGGNLGAAQRLWNVDLRNFVGLPNEIERGVLRVLSSGSQ